MRTVMTTTRIPVLSLLWPPNGAPQCDHQQANKGPEVCKLIVTFHPRIQHWPYKSSEQHQSHSNGERGKCCLREQTHCVSIWQWPLNKELSQISIYVSHSSSGEVSNQHIWIPVSPWDSLLIFKGAASCQFQHCTCLAHFPCGDCNPSHLHQEEPGTLGCICFDLLHLLKLKEAIELRFFSCTRSVAEFSSQSFILPMREGSQEHECSFDSWSAIPVNTYMVWGTASWKLCQELTVLVKQSAEDVVLA